MKAAQFNFAPSLTCHDIHCPTATLSDTRFLLVINEMTRALKNLTIPTTNLISKDQN